MLPMLGCNYTDYIKAVGGQVILAAAAAAAYYAVTHAWPMNDASAIALGAAGAAVCVLGSAWVETKAVRDGYRLAFAA